jgi:UDP-N-acetylmuramate: L-alanyl-gamma-D-glutamyl-meso-diaminopimelate ligase
MGNRRLLRFLAHVLEEAGEAPGYLIGAVPQNQKSNVEVGSGRHFVIEGDEYDTAFFDKKSKFLHYRPHRVLLTSIEFDHADIFKDYESVEASFRALLRLIPREGALIACRDEENVMKVVEETASKVVTYGFHPLADVRAESYEFSEKGTSFELWLGKENQGKFQTSLIGQHNLQNTLGVIACAWESGVSLEVIRKTLLSFKGMRRRQEVLVKEPFLVLDDFAHHPTAIRVTLEAVRSAYPGRKILAVFEPRSNTSTRHFFQKEFAQSLSLADQVFLAPLHREERIPVSERLNLQEIIETVQGQGSKAVKAVTGTVEFLEKELQNSVQKKDIILFMSNGAFGNLPHKMAQYAHHCV